jgi:hypothetical protein
MSCFRSIRLSSIIARVKMRFGPLVGRWALPGNFIRWIKASVEMNTTVNEHHGYSACERRFPLSVLVNGLVNGPADKLF